MSLAWACREGRGQEEGQGFRVECSAAHTPGRPCLGELLPRLLQAP